MDVRGATARPKPVAPASVGTVQMPTERFRRLMDAGLPPILIAALAGWMWAESRNYPAAPASLQFGVVLASTVDDDGGDPDSTSALPTDRQAAPEATASLQRLSISRQSLRRGGLGAKALMTFTIRNRNDYAVKDVELLCAFRGRDGRVVTERRRTITDTIAPKSRKAFPKIHVGHVSVTAAKAKCQLLAAARV
jgi:hypothetical protein